MNSSNDIPNARFEYREKGYQRHWIVITANLAGSDEPVAVEMSLDQWIRLAPVQYAVKLELGSSHAVRARPPTIPPRRRRLRAVTLSGGTARTGSSSPPIVRAPKKPIRLK
jgi:hypothetical protein